VWRKRKVGFIIGMCVRIRTETHTAVRHKLGVHPRGMKGKKEEEESNCLRCAPPKHKHKHKHKHTETNKQQAKKLYFEAGAAIGAGAAAAADAAGAASAGASSPGGGLGRATTTLRARIEGTRRTTTEVFFEMRKPSSR
jgi:hypothetical protein